MIVTTRHDIRRIIFEEVVREQRRLDEGWMETLGDIGLKVIMSGAGRKMAASACRGLATVVILPTKMDDAVFNAIGADKQNVARKVAGTITDVAGTMGGLIPLAKVLEACAKWLEGMTDADAASLQSAAQVVAKNAKGSTAAKKSAA